MKQNATPRDRRSARTEQAILDAGREIISRDGVSGLSMRALAEAIDYSPAALYRYFGSKEEIIGALCSLGFELFYQHLVRAVPEEGSAEEALYQCGQAYLEFARSHPDYYALMFNTTPSEPNQAPLDELTEDSAFGVLLGVIHRGIGTGEFKPQAGYGPMEMAMHCWVTVHGIAMLTQTQMGGSEPESRPMMDAILQSLGRSLQSE